MRISMEGGPTPSLAEQIGNWQVFYRKFGIYLSAEHIQLPPYQTGCDLTIIHPHKHMTRLQTALYVCERVPIVERGRFRDLLGFDTEQILRHRFHSTPARKSTEDACIWARNRPDETKQFDCAKLSELRAKKIALMTLPECILLALKFLFNTDVCLEKPPKGVLCGGSVDEMGQNPFMYHNDKMKLCLTWFKPEDASPGDCKNLWEVIVPTST